MRRKFILLLFVLSLLLGLSSVVYASAQYHGGWAEQPRWGSHYWENYTWSSTLTWYPYDQWDSVGVYYLQNLNGTFHFEHEVYKYPSSYCDRFNSPYVYTWNGGLPLTYFTAEDECGDPNWPEEIKVYFDKYQINAYVWYGHALRLTKQWSSAPSSGEVNYSFSNWWSDSWLGKIYYDNNFYATASDPSGMLE